MDQQKRKEGFCIFYREETPATHVRTKKERDIHTYEDKDTKGNRERVSREGLEGEKTEREEGERGRDSTYPVCRRQREERERREGVHDHSLYMLTLYRYF